MAGQDRVKVLREFERFLVGKSNAAHQFWELLPETERTDDLMFDLLMVELECAAWPPDQMRSSVELLKETTGSDDLVREMLAEVFVDRVEKGERPHVDDFAGCIPVDNSGLLKLPDDPFSLGARLCDRFKVQQRLGSGGFGVVYLAEDGREGHLVAIKSPVRSDDVWSSEAASNALEREVAVAKSLDYVGCPSGYAFFRDEYGHPFIVMEYIDGPSLADMIAKGPLEPVRAAMITADVCDILDHAHRKRILHRDVKPANIIFNSRGKVYLTDFGLAISEDESQLQGDEDVEGTLDFMSPDSLLGDSRAADGRRDIWAVGMTLFRALTGRTLKVDSQFEGALVGAIVAPNVEKEEFPPEVALPLQSVCRTCLERTPSLRYDTADEVAKALRHAVSGNSPKRDSKAGLHAWRFGVLLGDFKRHHSDYLREMAAAKGEADNKKQISVATFRLFGIQDTLMNMLQQQNSVPRGLFANDDDRARMEECAREFPRQASDDSRTAIYSAGRAGLQSIETLDSICRDLCQWGDKCFEVCRNVFVNLGEPILATFKLGVGAALRRGSQLVERGSFAEHAKRSQIPQEVWAKSVEELSDSEPNVRDLAFTRLSKFVERYFNYGDLPDVY